MSLVELKEFTFPSGRKANYVFANASLEFDSDELAQLKDFNIQGPLREELSEKSPRFKEFLLSRRLLLEILKNFKKRNLRSLALSLAHTKDASLVAAIPHLGGEGAHLAAGLGVDLEHLARKISDGAFQKLINQSSEKKINPLMLWCLKEACFKAHPQNQNLVLSDFTAVENGEKTFLVSCQKSPLRFEAASLEENNYLLLFARQL